MVTARDAMAHTVAYNRCVIWQAGDHTQVSPASRLRTPALVGSSLTASITQDGTSIRMTQVWPTTRQTTREGPAQRRTHNAGADRHYAGG